MIARSAAYRPDVRPHTFASTDGAAAHPPVFTRVLTADEPPRGRILIVEDQFPVALDIQKTLRDAGYRIVGPAGTQSEVTRLVRRGGLDAALIDADSRRSAPFAVADWLAAAGVPFAFLVSDTSTLPHDHAHRPQISKPWSATALLDTLDLMVNGGPGAVPPPASWPRHLPQL
jgi:DNA-binding NarL/FixJ family response regulator